MEHDARMPAASWPACRKWRRMHEPKSLRKTPFGDVAAPGRNDVGHQMLPLPRRENFNHCC